MPLITDVEAQLIAALKTAFTTDGKSVLKIVDSLPGEFDADSLRTMITEAPAVYVLFLGGKATRLVPLWVGLEIPFM